MITLRKRTKTTTYFKESSDLLDYNNEIGYFNKLYLTRVNEDECPKEPLNNICNIVYENVLKHRRSSKYSLFDLYGSWIDENDVLAIVMSLSKTNPELTNLKNMKKGCYRESLKNEIYCSNKI